MQDDSPRPLLLGALSWGCIWELRPCCSRNPLLVFELVFSLILCLYVARRCAAAAEAELAAAARTDPLAAYDVDVREEGAAIQEYLARLGD